MKKQKSDIRLIQAKLNRNKKREADLVSLIEKWESTKNPKNPDDHEFTQKDVIMMALEEWSETVPEYPPNSEYIFSLLNEFHCEIQKTIKESHDVLMQALLGLDLTTYVNTETGRSMHDEVGGLLVDEETLNNLTSEPTIEYDGNSDEPDGW